MHDLEALFARLAGSPFRRGFRLAPKDRAYLSEKGRETIETHARDFVAKRLAPAEPRNDGKQTPFRGHPVFVAQHATATCCRTCLAKWHRLPSGRVLGEGEQDRVVAVIMAWLDRAAAD